MYPRDIIPPALSSGFTYKGTGDYEKAIAAATRALTIDPDFVPAHLNLVFATSTSSASGKRGKSSSGWQRARSTRPISESCATCLRSWKGIGWR